MRWFRRHQPALVAVEAHSTALVPRSERVLVALAVHAQQLHDRLERIERRLDESDADQIHHPSHDDVLEVRVHSAKVAAELTRVSVELRAEIDDLASRMPAPLTDQQRRAQVLAESIVDLSDRLDTNPLDLRDREQSAGGWAATT
jgi:hypothetical protein